MKLALAFSVLATAALAEFDKNLPWGKRDYACINVFQGIPDHSTVSPGAEVTLKFNRASTGRCGAYLDQYPGTPYKVALYQNPIRNRDVVTWDKRVSVVDGVNEADGKVTITIPKNLAQDGDWYLRVDTTLEKAPQMPSLFNAAGPFTVKE
ncbi:hypothetical protein EYZ11_004341 [Aspergillus tanneri]|uniref:Uncharacterized protein n=1 Tax=Aspergillus tanneri TaxID=1220188 RepID=A0A4S3JN44_9EURO|nr:uncharacterized protein ATNIH1004_009559 [Aspergillus tanneri]KAA8642807.1 hypothetical protein ATNIH1004_009559 [Aspergillus tanneri]THC96178.1 hypothetical protein EYZ11_004341 [Aspergillus tanneri]